jgi:hypothetical protein
MGRCIVPPRPTSGTNGSKLTSHDTSAFDLTGFDRYVEEHGIPEEDYSAASRFGSPR